MPIIKAQENQAGCWIDGHWGHYGLARLIEIANNHGYEKDASMAADYLYNGFEPEDDRFEWIHEASEEAESWMNENIAPEGYCFGWYDGEFFLWSIEMWNEDN